MLLPNGLLPGIIWVESEFDGQFATCGPNSLGMAESYGTQVYIGAPVAGKTATTVIYNRMRAGTWIDNGVRKARADPGGASKMGGLESQAQADGFKTVRSGGSGWKAFAIAQLKAGAPVIIEPSHGQVLKDLITGQGMDATNLQYHYNLIVGYWPGGVVNGRNLPEGFWVADGDNGATNPIVNGVRTRVRGGHNLQFYSAANYAASAPVALMAVYPKVQIGLVHPAGFPGGWTDDGTTLKAPGGMPVVKGFRVYLLAHPELVSGPHLSDNYPIEPERAVSQVEAWNTAHGAGSVQTFHRMRLAWTQKDGVYVMWLGDEARYLEREKVGAA
jgi:hypothetical protein